ncbi:MAG: hypothetical protein U5O39_18085 [Gammaproteobacteria bacterium]|nr:hypothetical protein [Gammaproteobacteria bacterium]
MPSTKAIWTAALNWREVWASPRAKNSIRLLETGGFDDAEAVANRIERFERQLDVGDVQEIGVGRIDRLMPTLLALVAKEDEPDQTAGADVAHHRQHLPKVDLCVVSAREPGRAQADGSFVRDKSLGR